jgi:hypothetical protein
MSADLILQVAILLCSISALCLLTSRNHRMRMVGSVIGLLGQPAWFIAAHQTDNWAIMILTPIYAFGYARGIWNNAKR